MVAGIPEELFWRQTPRATQLALRSIAERETRLRDLAAWVTLHIPAVQVLAQVTGSLPTLESLRALVNGRPEQEQSDEELLAAGRLLGVAFAHLPEGDA